MSVGWHELDTGMFFLYVHSFYPFQMNASQMIRDIQSRILVSLDKDDAKYCAGDVIKGAVVINFPQEITVKGKNTIDLFALNFAWNRLGAKSGK